MPLPTNERTRLLAKADLLIWLQHASIEEATERLGRPSECRFQDIDRKKLHQDNGWDENNHSYDPGDIQGIKGIRRCLKEIGVSDRNGKGMTDHEKPTSFVKLTHSSPFKKDGKLYQVRAPASGHCARTDIN